MILGFSHILWEFVNFTFQAVKTRLIILASLTSRVSQNFNTKVIFNVTTNDSTTPSAQMNSNGCKASPPTLPPLPALRPPLPGKPIDIKSSRPPVETPSFYLDSLASMPADFLTRPREEEAILKQPYQPLYYFFYGTLTQPKTLSHILDLKRPPRSAACETYRLFTHKLGPLPCPYRRRTW